MLNLRRDILKAFFSKGAKPTAEQFSAFVDSVFNLNEDSGLLGLNSFDATLAYAAGKTVVYNGAIYQANVDVQPGPFDLSQWTKIACCSTNAISFMGTWNAKNNIPNLLTIGPARGDFYIVNVAGNTDLSGITDWNVGDWAMFDGTKWGQVINSNAITDAQNLGSEGTNVFSQLQNTILYFKQLISRNNSIKLNPEANVVDFSINFDDGGTSVNGTWSASKISSALSGKADIVSGTGLSNYLVALDSLGNIKNSGYLPSDFLAATTTASGITFTPAGNVTATNVQAAIVQLDSIKEPADPNIQIHIHDTTTNPHHVTQTQVGLGNVDNTSDINKPVSTAQAAADAAVLSTAKSYADSLVVGLLNDRGNYDASGNAYPTNGGSGTGGAIKKGDLWTISVGGNLGGNIVEPGDVIRALVNTPGQTNANWAITQNNIGYIPENSANKIVSFPPGPTDTQYPSAKLVSTSLAGKEGTITATGNTTDFWSGAKTFRNLGNDVRALFLTGLSLATNQVISATDTVIQAFGYLQKQVSDNLSTLNTHINDTANPHKVTKAQVGLSNVPNIKENFSATVDPAVTDDNTAGYSAGSEWVNTVNKKAFVCLDATTGAAVWKEITVQASVFGADYSRVESNPETGMSTTASFATKLAFGTGTRNGTYRIAWGLVGRHEQQQGQGKFQLMNTTGGATIGVPLVFEQKNSIERSFFGGVASITLTGVNQNIEIQFQTLMNGKFQYVQQAWIEIWRVA
ncbi:MAG: hypothetical protein ACXVP0_06535 [Bacteroidia bacterium]